MKSISIVTPCYNEEGNAEELYKRVRDMMARFPGYLYEHIFIDNCSRDRTLEILKGIAEKDRNVRIIANARDFGPLRSPLYAIYQASGDAVIMMAADLQDPPELIADFIRLWEDGYPIVLAIKNTSRENKLMFQIRKAYYRLVNLLSSIQTFENFTGFGLYDRKVVEAIRSFRDPYPYFRGIIAEIGLPHAEVNFEQPTRKRGISSLNFYKLYDIGMLAITNLSMVPLRIVTFFGFACSALSIFLGVFYFIYKLLFWRNFSLGVAPAILGLFFFSSVQMMALGIVGEYIGSILRFVQNRPLVVERERVNFEFPPGAANTGNESVRSRPLTGDDEEARAHAVPLK
jgi:glycosyltransferase involved in cell wall biosynthesis